MRADCEEPTPDKSRSKYRTGRYSSDSVVQQQRQQCPYSASVMKELSVRLEHRRQHSQQDDVVRQSDSSPDRPPRSQVLLSALPSYINRPLAVDEDSSSSDDDDDGYVKPNRGIRANHPDRDEQDDDEGDENDDDADDDDDDDASDCNTPGRRRRRRNKKCHDYINVLKCHD